MKKLKIILQSNIFFICLIILALGFFLIKNFFPNTTKLQADQKEFTGKIIDYKWINEEKVQIKIQLPSEKVLVEWEVPKNENMKAQIMTRSIVRIKGELELPSSSTLPNTFSYQNYLKTENIFWILKAQDLKIIKSGSFIDKIKQKIRNYCDSIENSSYLKRLLLGVKETENEEIEAIYRQNGISHIFAISGMHLSIIYHFILKKLKNQQKKKYIFSLLGLSVYYSVLSFSISSQRAYFFFILETINIMLELQWSKTKMFWINFCIHLLQNPFSIYQIGFQYSFLISFLFITMIKKEKKNLKSLLKNGMMVFAFSFPITAYHSYQINPWTIINNITLIPIVLCFLFPMLLLSLFCPILGVVLKAMIMWFEFLNIQLSKLPFSSLTMPKISIFWILFYYFLLLFYFYFPKKIIFFILSIVVSVWIFYPKWDSNFYVSYLDVGQGDSTLLIFPFQKEVILIDTGYENKARRNYFLTFLKSLGIDKIDTLILTHGDADHMGAAINLVDNIKINKVIFNIDEYNNLEEQLRKLLEEKQIKYIKGLKELNIDQYKLYFLNTKRYDNENDNSTVIYLQFFNYKFLFMGDAGIEKEIDLLKKYNLRNIDFLKVGHHGSNTSSTEEFINEIRPKYSIISVGKNNKYGHPNKEVLEHLEKSKIYRTDINGSIMFKIKKGKLNIKTYGV